MIIIKMNEDKSKNILGIIAVVIIVILIITNSLLFKFYITELRQNNNDTFNYTELNMTQKVVIVRDFIVDYCESKGIIFINETDKEKLSCLDVSINPESISLEDLIATMDQ